MKKKLEIGERFGLLIVVEHLGAKDYNNIYRCKCDCGNERNVALTYLNIGKIWHCGCQDFRTKRGVHKNMKYSPSEASFRAKAANYKSLAKQRNIEWNLNIEHVVKLLNNNCYYCGKPPSNKYNARSANRNYVKNSNFNIEEYNIKYNGIDRLDNSKGYNKENCVSCCTQCNTAKLNFTLKEFKEWINNIYKNFITNEKN